MDGKLSERIGMMTEQFSEQLREPSPSEAVSRYIPLKAPWTEEELRKAQEADEMCKSIINALRGKESPLKLDQIVKFRLIRNVIYVHRVIKRGPTNDEFLVPYVPDSQMKQAFKVIHCDLTAGHYGFDRTLLAFRRNFYNSSESATLKELCAICDPCIRAKGMAKSVPIKKFPIPIRPFQTVSSDILGPLPMTESGNRYIILYRCHSTRYTTVTALETKGTDEIIGSLRSMLSNYGPPETLLTDNAPEYKSEKLAKFCTFYNIKKVEIAPYHPSSNGLAERMNREINKYLRIFVYETGIQDWDVFLPTLQLTVNNVHNSSIGDSPFRLVFGYDSGSVTFTMPRPDYAEDDLTHHLQRVESIRNHARNFLIDAQTKMTDRVNEQRKEKSIKVNDKVYAKLDKFAPTRKLNLPISGPFTVIGKKGAAYNLRSEKTENKYDVHSDFIIPSTSSAPATESPEVAKPLQERESKSTPSHSYNLRPRHK